MTNRGPNEMNTNRRVDAVQGQTNRRPMPNARPAVQRGTSQRPVNSTRPAGARPMPKTRPVHAKQTVAESKGGALTAIVKNIKPILSVKQDKVETVKKKNSRPFPVSAVVIVTICTPLLMFTVFSYVQINEYTIEVASLKGELTDLVARRSELEVSLEEKNDMLEIERIATEEYGMDKADQLTKKHISLEQEDKIEEVEKEPTEDLTVVSGVMSAIAANFQGLWEYME